MIINPFARIVRSLLGVAVLGPALLAQPASIGAFPRPHVTGLSHVALWVKDVDQTRGFFRDYLGFAEAYSLLNQNGKIDISFIKVNDVQSIELFPYSDQKPDNQDNLFHIALETDDAQAMMAYLISKGVKGPRGTPLSGKVSPGRIGNLGFFAEDPDGHIVEFVQYAPHSWSTQHKGQNMPASRIAQRISHAGVMVHDLRAAMMFYHDVLGLQEFWRGNPPSSATLSWVNVRVPDGHDYLELMLYDKAPTVDQMHSLNHLCLEVQDVSRAAEVLKGRPLPSGCKATSAPKVGVNHKRQINCFDPDGTRVEIMEDRTFDGQPVPPSSAPPPNGRVAP